MRIRFSVHTAVKASPDSEPNHASDYDNRSRYIAESVFHGVDAAGQVVIRRQLKRRYPLIFCQKLPPCSVGIEACISSHHWSRAWCRSVVYSSKAAVDLAKHGWKIRQRAMRQRRPGRIAKGARRNAGLGARPRCPALQIAEFRLRSGSRRLRGAARPQKSPR